KQSDDAGSGGSPFRSGTPEPKKGSATAKYRPNDDGSPHFTVEVRTSDGKSFETHQVLTARKGRKTEVMEVEPGDFDAAPAATKTFELPDATAARDMQTEQMARGETGQWIPTGKGANSCATALCEVVAAGGGPLPAAPEFAREALYKLFNIPIPKGRM